MLYWPEAIAKLPVVASLSVPVSVKAVFEAGEAGLVKTVFATGPAQMVACDVRNGENATLPEAALPVPDAFVVACGPLAVPHQFCVAVRFVPAATVAPALELPMIQFWAALTAMPDDSASDARPSTNPEMILLVILTLGELEGLTRSKPASGREEPLPRIRLWSMTLPEPIVPLYEMA